MTTREWHKSSYSGASSSCVEVAEPVNHVLMRDTQNRDFGHVAFSTAEWRAFLSEVKTDRL